MFLLTVFLVGGLLICAGCKESNELAEEQDFVVEFSCSAAPGQQNGVDGVNYTVTLTLATPSGITYNVTNALVSFWEDDSHGNGRQNIAVPNALTTPVPAFQTTDLSFVEFVPDTESGGVDYTISELTITFVRDGTILESTYGQTVDITW
jgi:hypothetical protein